MPSVLRQRGILGIKIVNAEGHRPTSSIEVVSEDGSHYWIVVGPGENDIYDFRPWRFDSMFGAYESFAQPSDESQKQYTTDQLAPNAQSSNKG